MKNFSKSITLLGMMGAGKSSIGKIIAKNLNKKFFDLDKEIEKNLKLTVKEIFNNFGEEYFRKKEYENLKVLIDKKNTVIALGGGTFCQKRSSDLVKTFAISIWIDTNINEIYERLNGRNNRPLLSGLKNYSLKEKLTDIYNARYECYSSADLHVRLSNKTLAQSVSTTLKKINTYFNQGEKFEK